MTARFASWLAMLSVIAACGGGDGAPATSIGATSVAPPSSTTPATPPVETPTTGVPATTVAAEPLEAGLDWVRIAYDDGVFEDAALSDVTAFGTGWVAVGVTGDEGALGVWTSEDGVAWSTTDAEAFTGSMEHLRMVGELPQCSVRSYLRPDGSYPGPTVATDGELLVLGCGEGIWTSSDGAGWIRATVQAPDYYLPFDVSRTEAITLKYLTMADVSVGPSGWVAVGWGQYGRASASTSHTATVWVSADGLSWEIPTSNKADFWSGDWYQAEVDAVVAAGGQWIAAGGVRTGVDEGNMTVWASADGRTYTTLGDPALGTVLEPKQQGILGLIATPSGLVAVGWDSEASYLAEQTGSRDLGGHAAVWTSPDGAAWTRHDADAEAFVGEGYELATDIAAGGPGLVAVGAGFLEFDRWGIVWASGDGSSWTRVPLDRLDNLRPLAAVAAGPAGLVAVGGAGVWVSGDFPIADR